MKFKTISLTNFMAFEKTTLFLSDKGLVSISGENLDDASADSNGSGKSALLDALQWALFGTTAHGLTGDEVIRWGSKGGCNVTLEIEDGDITYKIGRNRKIKGVDKPNGAFIFSYSKAGDETNLTKGTDSLTQEVINEVLGCDENIFTSAIYVGQENMPDIPNMTDKEIKGLLEQASGLGELSDAYELARLEIKTIESEIFDIGREIEKKNNEIAADIRVKEIHLSNYENNKAEIEALYNKTLTPPEDIQIKIKNSEGELEKLNIEIKEFWDKIPKYKNIHDLKEMLTNIERTEQNISLSLNQNLIKAKDALEKEKQLFIKLRDEKDILEQDLIEIGLSLMGMTGQKTKCECCGQELDEISLSKVLEDKKNKKETITNRIKLLSSEIDSKRGNIENLNSQFKKAQSEYDTFFSGKESSKKAVAFKNLIDVASSLNNKQNILQNLIKTHHEIKDNYEKNLLNQIESLQLKNKNISTHLSKIKADIEDKKQELLEKSNLEKTLMDELEIMQSVIKTFSPAGVRARVLDTITPYLNNRTSFYLSKLSDGELEVEWSTIKLKADGTPSEKFNVSAKKAGTTGNFKSLSGGQRRKVRLACALALHDLIAARATKTLDLSIYDEVDSALDQSGLERLMVILEAKAREKGTILVISHNSLKDWIDSNSTVTLSKGIATVSGDLT